MDGPLDIHSNERMDREGAAAAASNHRSTTGSNGTEDVSSNDYNAVVATGDTGRIAQIRAIKLLVLFMTNFVRKGLVDPQRIYFEAQEVCVRYIWVGEVRTFRAFLYGEEEDATN